MVLRVGHSRHGDFRGRVLNSVAIRLLSCCVTYAMLCFLGKYWRVSPWAFSLFHVPPHGGAWRSKSGRDAASGFSLYVITTEIVIAFVASASTPLTKPFTMMSTALPAKRVRVLQQHGTVVRKR